MVSLVLNQKHYLGVLDVMNAEEKEGLWRRKLL